MFDIRVSEEGEVCLSGRFDASQVDKAESVFNSIQESSVVNFEELIYISSAGLGVLLATQKRLMDSGKSLKIIKLNEHISDIFRYAGFDTIFEIE